MDDEPSKDQIGGVSAHIGDCHIWAAIHYLDSYTGYREFLPGEARRLPLPDDKLIMLDDVRRPRRFLGMGIILGELLTLLLLILLHGYGC